MSRADASSARLLASDVFTMPLEGESQPGMWIESGWPTARTAKLERFGGVTASVWEITSGVVADIENDECIVVLSGDGSLRFEDGESIKLTPGRCFRVRAGDRTEWTAQTTVRALTIADGWTGTDETRPPG